MEAPSASSSSAHEQRAAWSGRLLIVSAAALWSTSGFFAKAPIFAGWDGAALAFWRAAFASLLLIPGVRRPVWSVGLLPMVLVFAAMNFTYLSSMKAGEPSVAIWLQNTAPLWVFLVGVFVLKEPVHSRDWALIVLTLMGVSMILMSELRNARSAAVWYGLASGVTYAGVMLSIRQLRRHDPFWLVALNHVGAAAILAPLAFSSGTFPQGWQWLYLLAFGMLQMGVPYVLFARGLKTVPSHQAATLALVEPLLLPVWVYLAWGRHPSYQPPSWWTLLGGTCILAGLLYRYWGSANASAESELKSSS